MISSAVRLQVHREIYDQVEELIPVALQDCGYKGIYREVQTDLWVQIRDQLRRDLTDW